MVSVNYSAVIDRMKESAIQRRQFVLAEGKELGAKWAADDAEPWELRLLDESGLRATAFDDFFRLIVAPGRGDDDQDIFWTNAVGDGGADSYHGYEAEYLTGFTAGALEVWGQVKNRI